MSARRPHWLRGYYDSTGSPIDEHAAPFVPPPLPRFSRTLGEQMPKDAVYANAVERRRPRASFWNLVCWALAGLLIGLALSAPLWFPT